jgi:hypothetical protein
MTRQLDWTCNLFSSFGLLCLAFHPLASRSRQSGALWAKQTAYERRDKFSDQQHRRGHPETRHAGHYMLDGRPMRIYHAGLWQRSGAYNHVNLP